MNRSVSLFPHNLPLSAQTEFRVGDKIASNQLREPKGTAEVIEVSDGDLSNPDKPEVKCRFLPDGKEFSFNPLMDHYWITVK